MSNSKKIILASLGVMLFLMVFAAAVLPTLVKPPLIKALEEATGRTVLIEKVFFNPLTLSIDIRGVAIEERGGGPFFSMGGLKVAVSPTSLYRRALVLSELVIDSPSLRVVRAGATRFNFTDIVERREQREKEPKKSEIFPFVLKNVRLAGGTLEFDDRVVADGGRSHLIRNIEISIPWLSSLPADRKRDASLRGSMAVNGAPLTVTAESRPFEEGMHSSAHLILNRLDLPELAGYLPSTLPLELASGKLTLDANIAFRLSPGEMPDLSVSGLARVDFLTLNHQNNRPLLKLPSLAISTANVTPLTGIFAINAITLEQPELFVHRNSRGEWMYERLLSAKKGRSADEKPDGFVPSGTDKASSMSPPRFSIASLAINKGRVHFQDDFPRGGFRAEIGEINLTAHNIDNSNGKTGRYNLAMQADSNTRLASAGIFAIHKPEVKASVGLTGLSLQRGWPYLASYLTSPLKGVANLAGEVAFSRQAGLSVSSGRLSLDKFSLQGGAGEGIALTKLGIEGVAFGQQANRLRIDRINLSGGEAVLSRTKDGEISLQSLLVCKESDRKKRASAAAKGLPARKKLEAVKPFTCHLKRIEFDKFNIAFTDYSRAEKPRFVLRDAQLSLTDLRAPEQQLAKVKFASTIGKDATLRIAGNILSAPFRYRGDLKISRLPIRDFQAYYPETFNFHILGGLLDANMSLDVGIRKGTPEGSFRGDIGIGSMHMVDFTEEDILKWQRLQLDRIEGDLRPFQLAVGQVSLNKFYSRIIVRQDGTLNLQELIKKEGAAPPAGVPSNEGGRVKIATGEKSVTAGQIPPRQGRSGDIRVGAVTIADGTVLFTDRHLPDDFETKFYNLGGRISGLSSDASTLADVDLRGNLENHSPLRITGKINPLRKDLFVNLKLSFADIELSPLSPYSETYLGYILKQGKLFIDLDYHIEEKKLVSQNRMRIDQLNFGGKVESDRATNLPVKLGLALLKDRNGEINLDIPVMGRIDDPRFNIWRVVFQVVKNLLVKAVTAPFSFLSSLFAGEGDLSVIAFTPGSSVLEPLEQKKLAALATGLSNRPSLKISVMAYVDHQKDADWYRQELFERKLSREKFIASMKERQNEAGESTETTIVTGPERLACIKALYARERFPKPRDVKGAEVGLPEQEMVKLLLTNIKIDKDELENLADERMDAVKNFLVDKGKIRAERVFKNRDDIFKIPRQGDGAVSRVELSVSSP